MVEWEPKRLGDGVLKVGHGKSQQEIETSSGKYPILATGGVIGRTNTFLYDKPSVLIGRKGTIDKPQYMDTPFWTIDTLFYTMISKDYYPKFLYYAFCRIEWLKYNEASGVPSLSAKVIEDIELILPKFPEQRAIANVLSEVDAYIDAIEKLIAKKRAVKQGAMQELLTGKRRLPGFEGAWVSVSLGKLCFLITDGSHESPIEVINGYYMPSVKDMTDTGFDFSSCKQISKLDYERLVNNGCRPKMDDVVIAKDGSMLKYSFVIKKEMPIVILSSIAILRPDSEQISSEFLAHYFRQPKFIDDAILNYKTGTGVPRIVLKNFKEIMIAFPQEKDEQIAIATLLTDLDMELDALTLKLKKARSIKQGMMSELLTGRIRLIKEDVVDGEN